MQKFLRFYIKAAPCRLLVIGKFTQKIGNRYDLCITSTDLMDIQSKNVEKLA